MADECKKSADKRRLMLLEIANKKDITGFSLLEVLIVLVLLVIAAAYFYPLLHAKQQAKWRAQAQSALIDLSQSMNNFKARTGSYAGAAGSRAQPEAEGSPWITEAQVPGGGARTLYRLRIATSNARGFELRAVPVGAQVDDPCGTLTLTATDVRGMLNAHPEWRREQCWQEN